MLSFLRPVTHRALPLPLTARFSHARLLNTTPLSPDVDTDDPPKAKPKSITPLRRSASASLPIRATRTPTRGPIQPVITLATAERFSLPRLRPFLPPSSQILHEALWVPSWGKDGKEGEVFVFGNGAFVCWGLREDEARRFAEEVIDRAPGSRIGPLVDAETEDLEFVVDRTENTRLQGDLIILGSSTSSSSSSLSSPSPLPPNTLLARYAYSQALSRSTALSGLETSLERYLTSMARLPSSLALTGKPGMPRAALIRKLGELMLFRQGVNLNRENFSDVPDFYWGEPELEGLFVEMTEALEVKQRTASVNDKITYAAEAQSVLRQLLTESSTHSMELVIIALIAVEVVIAIIRDGPELWEMVIGLTHIVLTRNTHPTHSAFWIHTPLPDERPRQSVTNLIALFNPYAEFTEPIYRSSHRQTSSPFLGPEGGAPPGLATSVTDLGRQSTGSVAARTCSILENPVLYRALLKTTGPDAQVLLDIFQWVLDDADLAEDLRRQLVVATQRLSIKSGLYPVCYELRDVVQDNQDPVAGGGFADIYKGSFGGQVVCLKTIRVYQDSQLEHVLKQFSKEVILWGQLTHTNVLPIYGLYRFKDRLCIVAPWLHNGDVITYLENNPTADRRSLATPVSVNLMFTPDLKHCKRAVGRARLCDFGISSICDPKIRAWTTQSSVGSKGGSTRWQAPELFDLESDEDVQNTRISDVYAFGCMCYEVFTGNVPFYQISRDATVMLQVKEHKRPLRPNKPGVPWQEWGLTESIWQLMEDCWKAAAEERPAVQEIIERMMPLVQETERARGGGGVVTPAHFRRRMSKPPDEATIAAFHRTILVLSWGSGYRLSIVLPDERLRVLKIDFFVQIGRSKKDPSPRWYSIDKLFVKFGRIKEDFSVLRIGALLSRKEPIAYEAVHTVSRFPKREMRNSTRTVGGGLNDQAGRLLEFDALAAKFFTAPAEARDSNFKEASLFAADVTSGNYLRAMRSHVDAKATPTTPRHSLAKHLEKHLHRSKLDAMKIKHNILSAEVEEV
ncbi:hypothetical protein DXG01_009023 [Tephrocybe rancida]|nr:hypothetical protein DXG01_009023 [Tephrocybe rancida]